MVKINTSFWKNKKILLTGHTGFKGTWLLLWLLNLGADVWGYSKGYEDGSLFDLLLKERSINLTSIRWKHFEGDVLDKEKLKNVVELCEPDIVIHMAAQAIVRSSYRNPIETWETNVNGTLNLLEALKTIKRKCSCLVVTTDKVYENNGDLKSFKEDDKLGGIDPYSVSKAAVEIAVSSWRNSFLDNANNLKLATARAGNVIGGGDNAVDRIVPDIVRSLLLKEKIHIRNPSSSRPWQHVLECLNGYLILIERLSIKDNKIFDCFNFGPKEKNSKTVKQLVEKMIDFWEGDWIDISNKDQFFESKSILLDVSKAKHLLNWEPFWDFNITVRKQYCGTRTTI